MQSVEKEILTFCQSKWGIKTFEKIGLKLGEESGEVQGAIIKLGENKKTVEDLELEIGDCLIVLSQLAAKLDKTLEQIRTQRFIEIQQR